MREESTEFEDGVVIQEFCKGFRIGETLLRPSMVKVSAGPGPENTEPVSPSEPETQAPGPDPFQELEDVDQMTMVNLVRFYVCDRRLDSSTIRTLTAVFRIIRHYHFNTSQTPKIPGPFASVQSAGQNIVAVFWDLDNKPPRSVSPFDAAIRLKKAAESFGAVRYKS
ncbi:hypothetical protein SSX86_023832 [Deinandra increscens subsp. villosa]|uniref:Uncharacterized protein n=1 Tax=Deinandra increscens subsp. villosa TaxID=3103831 RepID=A0AAP0CGY4_9ASTR